MKPPQGRFPVLLGNDVAVWAFRVSHAQYRNRTTCAFEAVRTPIRPSLRSGANREGGRCAAHERHRKNPIRLKRRGLFLIPLDAESAEKRAAARRFPPLATPLCWVALSASPSGSLPSANTRPPPAGCAGARGPRLVPQQSGVASAAHARRQQPGLRPPRALGPLGRAAVGLAAPPCVWPGGHTGFGLHGRAPLRGTLSAPAGALKARTCYVRPLMP